MALAHLGDFPIFTIDVEWAAHGIHLDVNFSTLFYKTLQWSQQVIKWTTSGECHAVFNNTTFI